MGDTHKKLMVGNIHETECLEIPRMSISQKKIAGKCFGEITAFGIEQVSLGNLEFKPIYISSDWMKFLCWNQVSNISHASYKKQTHWLKKIDAIYYIFQLNEWLMDGQPMRGALGVWYPKQEEQTIGEGDDQYTVPLSEECLMNFAFNVDYVHQLQNFENILGLSGNCDKLDIDKIFV